QIILGCSGVAREFIERHERDSILHRRNPLVEGHLGSESTEQQWTKSLERKPRQIVLLRWKSDGGIELGHRYESSVEPELASVIATAKRTRVPLAFDDDRTAMGADVGETANGPFVVRSQHQ